MAHEELELFKRLFRFREPVDKPGLDLAAFHEWAVQLAIDSHETKRVATWRENPPIALYLLYRRGEIHVLETEWHSEAEKHEFMRCLRMLCRAPVMGVEMMATINEVWIAANYDSRSIEEFDELLKKYGQVRYFPDREDGLMVASYRKDPRGAKATKWVVKAKVGLLARDDVDMDAGQMVGRNFGFFDEEKGREDIVRPAED